MSSLTVKTATQYCLSKIKAQTVQQALEGITFFNTLENTSYISKLLCANRFIELCRTLQINGVTGFYLTSDDVYKASRKEDRKIHKLETVFADNFPDYKFKTICEYYREFTNLVNQDERCFGYEPKQWLALCGGKNQKELRLPNSVHTDKAQLTAALVERKKKPPVKQPEDTPPVEVETPPIDVETPPVPEQVDAPPSEGNGKCDAFLQVADSSDDETVQFPTGEPDDNDTDTDTDDETDDVKVFQTPSEYDAIRKIADDLTGNPEQIHKFICSLMSATEINVESIAKHHKKSDSETYNVYRQGTTGHIRPKRR